MINKSTSLSKDLKGLAQYSEISKYLSEERLKIYGKDPESRIGNYVLNIFFSKNFYMPLHFLEVVLRNSLDQSLSGRFGDDWFQKNT